MTDDLIARLRALSRHEHSDMTIGDEAADALEAARDGWQPIETAPNEPALLYWPAQGPYHGPMMGADYPGMTPNRPPTHWQPLPAPPKEARNG